MRLIDADALANTIHGIPYGDIPNQRLNAEDVYRAVADAPTVAMGDRWATIKWTPDLDKFAHDVAYRGLNEFSFMGKSIREWVEIILEHNAREKQSGWVSVGDRLPDKCGPYLVLYGGTEINWLKQAVRFWTSDSDGNYWRGAEAGSRITGITHWMPLPEPPKGEDQDVQGD